jgi:hypothetical protein
VLRSLTSAFTTPSPALSAEPTARAPATDAVQGATLVIQACLTGIAEVAYVLWSRFLGASRLTPAGATGSASSSGACLLGR